MNVEPVSILYEQGPCLVAYKPAGLLTQAPPGIDSLETRLKRFLQHREGKEHNLYLAIIHRLDRPVTGCLVFARHVRAARRLAEQFEARQVEKKYWAVVEGRVSEEAGSWRDQMRKVPGESRSEIVDTAHPDAQHAVLHYRVLGRSERHSFLEIELETGRTHQIRLQASAHGHPVLGDELYGSTTPFGPASDDQRARWIALHARSLAFVHPMTREPARMVAELPQAWRDAGFPVDGE